MTSMDSSRDFDEDKALIVEDPCCNHQSTTKKRRSIRFYVIFSLLNTIIACITIYFSATAPSRQSQVSGWDTELPDARKVIEYEERAYTGALTYDAEKHEIVKVNDSELEFFGPPSAQIDDAWQYLLHGEFPIMTEAEAAPFGAELQPIPNDHKYHFEYVPNYTIDSVRLHLLITKTRPDMFHSLHCINAIRMNLNPVMYGNSSEYKTKHHHHGVPASVIGPNYENTHLEHCLDRLRQAVMCHGDLTPAPLFSFKGFPIALGKSGKHTCRKFEPIRKWMDERGEGAFEEI